MITIRHADQRGRADLGWLDSRHTFSFARYYDPRFMGFGDLRVINEDRVAPGTGFGTHGHRDMEIVSYMVSGELSHRDSTGSTGVIRRGEVQVMSAGRGVRHSEMNDHESESAHFLQIWVQPSQTGVTPRHETRDFGRTPGLTKLVSPDGDDGSLVAGQDFELFRLLLSEAGGATIPVDRARVWIQVVHGQLNVDGHRLRAGDGAALTDASELSVTTDTDVEALIFMLS